MILLLTFPTTAHEGTRIGIQLFTYGLLPYLLPYLILTGWLLRLTAYLDNISRAILYIKIYIISAFGGFPTGSYVVSHYYEKQALSEKEAATLLAICHFPSPLFTIGFVGNELLQQPAPMWKYLLYIHSISIILVVITYIRYSNKVLTIPKQIKVQNPLLASIKDSVPTICNVAATIIFFSTIVSITIHIISYYTTHPLIHLSVITFLEMTQALHLANQYVSETFRASIMMMILTIQGISIHTQIAVIAKTAKLPLKRYFYLRLGMICWISICIALSFSH